jgi:hypothetical protein
VGNSITVSPQAVKEENKRLGLCLLLKDKNSYCEEDLRVGKTPSTSLSSGLRGLLISRMPMWARSGMHTFSRHILCPRATLIINYNYLHEWSRRRDHPSGSSLLCFWPLILHPLTSTSACCRITRAYIAHTFDPEGLRIAYYCIQYRGRVDLYWMHAWHADFCLSMM